MKQIWPNYSYSPTTNVLTLTGLNIDRDQLLLVTAADRGRIMYNFADSTVTASAFTAGANTGLTLVASTAGLTTTAALVIYYDDQVAGISGTVDVDLVTLVGTVNNVSNVSAVGSLPAITGTVTVGNFPASQSVTFGAVTGSVSVLNFPASQAVTFSAVSISNFPASQAVTFGAVTGSVSVLNFPASQAVTFTDASLTNTQLRASAVTIGGTVTASISGTVPVSGTFFQTTQPVSLATLPTLAAGTAQIGSVTASISGTVPISISSVTIGNSLTIGSLPAISGTVTANASNGTLTTRFGSVVTANTSFASTAVTNLNRKYLLIQNVTTLTNAITIGIGFTPTTTQGIQLIAGAGLTFDGSYIPTGAVNILSSVTASTFTILEA